MSGSQQSPIDLNNAIPAPLSPLALDWKPVKFKLDGHTIMFEPGCTIRVERLGHEEPQTVEYELVKGHLHRPGEHRIGKLEFAMEIHLVHQAEDGYLAVVGIFVERGDERCGALDELFGAGETFDPSTLLPRTREYYRYEGSLTTTPFSEIVTWLVLRNPIPALQNQLEPCPKDARPIQPRNRRHVLLGG